MIDQLEDEVELIERHMQILGLVVENEPIGIVRLSNESGYPHHKVRYSLRTLEESGYLEPTSQGAVPTEAGRAFLDKSADEFDRFIERLEDMKGEGIPVEN